MEVNKLGDGQVYSLAVEACAAEWSEFAGLSPSERRALVADVRDCAINEDCLLATAARSMARRIRPATLRSYVECLLIQSTRPERSR